MSVIRLALTTVLIALAAPLALAAPDFASPSSNFSVAIQEVKRGSTELHEDFILYRISFHRADTKSLVSKTDFNDVYGLSTTGKPTPVATLFRQIDWSPKEDFAILPSEGWMDGPGTPDRKVVALNRQLRWKEANIHLNDLVVWPDALRVLGNVSEQEGRTAIDMFDGRTGKMVTFKQGKSPVGYELTAGSPPKVTKVLDVNQTDEDKARFKPECFVLDTKTLKLTPTACRKSR